MEYPPEATRETPPSTIKDSLALGSVIDDFSLDSQYGRWNFSSEIKKGPLVIVFYRGYWCPFCNEQLKDLEKNLALFKEKGVSLIAISNDELSDTKELANNSPISFPLLSNPSYSVIKQFGVFDPANEIAWPAVFIINEESKITWKSISSSYKNRPPVSEIIANAPKGR